MVQERLLGLYTHQKPLCYYCGKRLATIREIYSGFCEECMQKKEHDIQHYLEWPISKFVIDSGRFKKRK